MECRGANLWIIKARHDSSKLGPKIKSSKRSSLPKSPTVSMREGGLPVMEEKEAEREKGKEW